METSYTSSKEVVMPKYAQFANPQRDQVVTGAYSSPTIGQLFRLPPCLSPESELRASVTSSNRSLPRCHIRYRLRGRLRLVGSMPSVPSQ